MILDDTSLLVKEGLEAPEVAGCPTRRFYVWGF